MVGIAPGRRWVGTTCGWLDDDGNIKAPGTPHVWRESKIKIVDGPERPERGRMRA